MTARERDRLPCPHCGHMFTDLWDYSWESEVVITECGECGGAVDIVRHMSVRYEMRKGTDDHGAEIVTDRQRMSPPSSVNHPKGNE